MTSTRFPIRYSRLWWWLLALLGMPKRLAYVELTSDLIKVRFAWGFRARIPRSSVASASRRRRAWGGIGVHGWRGTWLVNGATTGIVAIELSEPVRAHVCGFPVRLRRLLVSLDDPDELVAALG